MAGRIVRFDNYEVDFGSRELRKFGIRVRLQQKPFRVLELLLSFPGKLVTRDDLIRFLWPDSHVSFAHGLNTAVNTLRQALGESSRKARLIETLPGLGYRFNAEVEEVTALDSKATTSRVPDKHRSAYEDCLKGQYFLDRISEEETHKALAFFKSAATDETCSSRAHAGMAEAYCQLALLGSADLAKLASQARSAAAFALGEDPDLSQAHVSDGQVKMIFDWDWSGAQEAVNRALALDGDSASAHILQASLLLTAGRGKEAAAFCRQALAVDALSFRANLLLAACHYAACDFKSAVDQCWNILTLTSHFGPAELLLALAYEELGMLEEAVVEFQNAGRCTGLERAATSGLGHVYATAGKESEADKILECMAAQYEEDSASAYGYAVLCQSRRRKEEALHLLEESARQREPGLLWLAADARLANLRGEERFQTVLSQLGMRSLEEYSPIAAAIANAW